MSVGVYLTLTDRRRGPSHSEPPPTLLHKEIKYDFTPSCDGSHPVQFWGYDPLAVIGGPTMVISVQTASTRNVSTKRTIPSMVPSSVNISCADATRPLKKGKTNRGLPRTRFGAGNVERPSFESDRSVTGHDGLHALPERS